VYSCKGDAPISGGGRGGDVKAGREAIEPSYPLAGVSAQGGLDELSRALILVTGPEAGMPVIARHAREHFGVAALALRYTPLPTNPRGVELRCTPVAARAWADEDLARRAIVLRVSADSSDGRLWAEPLPVRRPGLAAIVVQLPPQGLPRPSGAKWEGFLDLVTHWLSGQLELRRLRVSLRRLERAERLQRSLYAIADLASSELDMPEMLRELHQIVGELMYAENFYIVLCDPARGTLRFIYFADTQDQEVPPPEQEFVESEIPNSLTAALIRYGRPLMGPSEHIRERLGVAKDPYFGPDSEDWLGVPLVNEGEVRGAIVVQSYDKAERYSDSDRALLSYVAQHILTALNRKQAQEEMERRVEQRTRELAESNRDLTAEIRERQRSERLQAALFRIAELANTTESLNEFYAAVHEIVGGLLYARNFLIGLLSDDQTELDFPYAVDERDVGITRRKLKRGLTEYVLRTGQPLLADRGEIDRLNRIGEVSSIGSRAECWLGVPLICSERTVGALVLQSYSPDVGYSERDQELLQFVSYHIASGLERKRAQESLRVAYADLERRVGERTSELADANRELRDQIAVREQIEQKLKYEAMHDGLTGLPNRAYLLDRLGRALARYRRDRSRRFAVLFLDLDRFKIVNDSMGHLTGDELLKEAGARLSSAVREPDVVARLGGDEFAVLLDDLRNNEQAAHVAQRIIQSLLEPIQVAGLDLFTSASIGIAYADPRYQSAEELLRDADVAMYRAKANGRSRFEIFDETLHREALRLLDLEGDLRRALQRQEFEPYFQPIVRLMDSGPVGYETLLRWKHPQRGLLLPGDFLAVAEDSGLVEQIDRQVFERAMRLAPPLLHGTNYVCINVSARHFRNPDLDQFILGLVRSRGIDPSHLRIEVTEGVLFENPDLARRTLQRLRDAGVFAQIDDFGTGYSSLSYLHRFPIHALKIDRSFIADLRPGDIGGSAPIVRAILALARSLGIEAIAEGIETTAQRDALLRLGCEFGQGFLFAHPRPADEI